MYTATMIYPIRNEFMEDFVGIWENRVLRLAVGQPGFVRMQLLTREDEAMAIGTWKDKKYAEDFMALGPFKELMEAIGPMLTSDPKPTIWNLATFAG